MTENEKAIKRFMVRREKRMDEKKRMDYGVKGMKWGEHTSKGEESSETKGRYLDRDTDYWVPERKSGSSGSGISTYRDRSTDVDVPETNGSGMKKQFESVPKGKSLNVGDWSFENVGNDKVKICTPNTEKIVSMAEAEKHFRSAESKWGKAKVGSPNSYYDY